MLEAPVAVADREHLEQVALERRARPRPVEELDVEAADARQVRGEAPEVGVVPTRDRHVVGRAAGLEGHVREVGDLDGVVDQLVVVRGTVEAESPLRRAIRG